MNLENTVNSIKDDKVLEARSLHSSKGRFAAKKFLLEGEEPILWSLGTPLRNSCMCLLTTN